MGEEGMKDANRQAHGDVLDLLQRQNLIESERVANDQAYASLAAELEREYPGKWVVIAHGELQGVGESLDEVAPLAPTALDRLVFQVGVRRAQEVEFGLESARELRAR